MTNRMRTKVRLVKCPKCAKILPEPEQVPLYTCGGCGTILQAKYYRSDRAREPGSQEHNVVQSNSTGCAPDGGEPGGLSQGSRSGGDQSLDQNDARNCNSDRIGVANSNGTSHDPDGREFGGSSQGSGSAGEQSPDQNAVRNCNSEHIGVPDGGESDSSNRESGSAGEQLPDQNAAGNCNFKQIGVAISNCIDPPPDGGEYDSSIPRSDSSGEKSSDQNAVRNCDSEQTRAATIGHAFDGVEYGGSIQGLRSAGEQSSYQIAVRNHNDQQIGVANGNSISFALDGEESATSSQRSSHAGEQSSDQNAVKNCNFEQIAAPHSAHSTSLLDESEFIVNKSQGIGETDSKTDQFDCSDCVLSQNDLQLGAANPASDASSSEDDTIVENKESEQLNAANNEVENVNGGDEKCRNDQQNEDTNSTLEIGRLTESQMLEDHTILENTESQQLTMSNGLVEDGEDEDEHGHSGDIACGKQKEVREVNSSRDAPVFIESLATEKKELSQSALGNGIVHDGLGHNMLEESKKEHVEGKHSHEHIVAAEVDSHDSKKPCVLVKSSKEEGNGKDQTDLVECMGEQFEKIGLSEAPLSTHDESASVSALPIDTRLRNTHEMSSSNVTNEPQSASDSLYVREGSRQKTGNLDDCAIDGSENERLANNTMKPVNTRNNAASSMKAVPRSLTKGSPAYDGSVSSFDGNDDRIPEQQEHIHRKAFPGNVSTAAFVGTEASSEWNNLPSSRAYRSSRIRNQAKSSQILLGEKMKRGILEEDECLEENGLTGRNRNMPPREGFPPRVPFYRSSEVAYETGSCSSFINDELQGHRMHHHPYRYEDPEPWLRKVYAQKGNMIRRRFLEPSWRDAEFLPMYYNHETSGEIYHRARYHGYTDRRRRSEIWSLSGSLPRMPYSGEVFNRRHHIHDPYTHHHPEDLRWSTQLPPSVPAAYCCQGLCPVPSMETSWDPYDSYPMSPPRFLEPESYPWGHDTAYMSDDQRHKDQVMRKLYVREKRQAVKRYYRSLAGGAPFVTCYICFKVLQLPDDFLLSRRRTPHRLKCGSCSSILEFSLENERNLAPCMVNGGEDTETNAGRNVDSPSLHANRSHVQNAGGSESLQHNSTEASSQEKNKLESRNSRVEQGSENASGPSVSRQMKVSWQLPARSKSPLHRLMGYSSPNQLLDGREVEDIE